MQGGAGALRLWTYCGPSHKTDLPGKEEALQVIDLQGFIMVRDLGLEPRTQGLRK